MVGAAFVELVAGSNAVHADSRNLFFHWRHARLHSYRHGPGLPPPPPLSLRSQVPRCALRSLLSLLWSPSSPCSAGPCSPVLCCPSYLCSSRSPPSALLAPGPHVLHSPGLHFAPLLQLRVPSDSSSQGLKLCSPLSPACSALVPCASAILVPPHCKQTGVPWSLCLL